MTRSPARARYDTLSKRVGEILHFVWGPIGVIHYPQARDEYDSYVPHLVGMLTQGKKKEEIAAHLSRIEKELMGLSDTKRARAHASKVAQILVEHYAWLKPEANQPPEPTAPSGRGSS